MEEKDVDIVAQKYLLMLVQVVCALAFSTPSQLPNRGGEEFSYFEQFGKGRFDDNRYNNCGCFKTFVMALAQLFLYQSVKGFTFIDDGQLVVVPDKNTTKSYVLEFLKSRPILDSPHNDDGSFSS